MAEGDLQLFILSLQDQFQVLGWQPREEYLWLEQSNSNDKINTQMCKFAFSDRCTIT